VSQCPPRVSADLSPILHPSYKAQGVWGNQPGATTFNGRVIFTDTRKPISKPLHYQSASVLPFIITPRESADGIQTQCCVGPKSASDHSDQPTERGVAGQA
jgi:hypothetical protein